MKSSRTLQSAFITFNNKQRLRAQHPARSISVFPTTTTQRQHLLAQRSLPFSNSFTSPYSSSASSPSSSSPTMDTTEGMKETNDNPQPESQAPSNSSPLPALPAVDGTSPTLEVGGAALRLDHLGPLVVNEDGTLSRIANWEKMADIERENTVRILGKRNQMRLAKLRAAKEPGSSENDSGTGNK